MSYGLVEGPSAAKRTQETELERPYKQARQADPVDSGIPSDPGTHLDCSQLSLIPILNNVVTSSAWCRPLLTNTQFAQRFTCSLVDMQLKNQTRSAFGLVAPTSLVGYCLPFRY